MPLSFNDRPGLLFVAATLLPLAAFVLLLLAGGLRNFLRSYKKNEVCNTLFNLLGGEVTGRGPALFFAHGQDPRRFDVVVVKSPHCEAHMFADWCARQINVDAPGATSANLRSLGHTQCARPIFPLDEGVTFSPRADIFRRSRS